MFFALLGGGLLFLALLLYFTGDIEFQRAVGKVVKRLLKTGALRQLAGILGAMLAARTREGDKERGTSGDTLSEPATSEVAMQTTGD